MIVVEHQFYLQVSNSLNQLAEKLSAEIKNQRPGVFQRVYIVTQTEGMNSWLKMQLARHMGIAANIHFLKPNDLISQVYFILGGPFTKSLSSDDLNWLLYKELGDKAFIPQFPRISDYYHYEGIDKEVKRMALAGKVSDLFDQYQIYRPLMIQSWNEDRLYTHYEEEIWQKELWQRTKNLSGLFPDKTNIGKYIHEALADPVKIDRLKEKLPVIYLFGISVITEYHLEILQHLSQFVEIRFLLLNPAPMDYWFEDKSEKLLYFLKKIGRADVSEVSTGNTLLTAWGKVLQDTFSLLFKNEALINSYDVIGNSRPHSDSLLHKIQASVFDNTAPEKHSVLQKDLLDGSLTISSCYGPVREIEALYNYLVHLVDKKNEDLSSRDIIVMVSDIDLYASYIKAIFDNAPYRFQYTIADESFAASDSISNALYHLLSLAETEFTAEAVVRLLDFSSIRNRNRIENISRIRDVTEAANIRFGTEGAHSDDSVYVSWRYGLKRIMYGICLSGGKEYGQGRESIFPMDNIESSEMFNIVRFVHFAENLILSLAERKKPKKLKGWVNYVENVLNAFVVNKEELQDEDYGILLTQLEEYNTINELVDEEISYEVFAHNFLPALTGATRSKAFAGGGITFCSLIPMRSIPFKVVCLLGMNFDKFPRLDKKTSFNLIEKDRRKGDRNIKENDKHLFLETLLSAQQFLYISYTGQSVKDNSGLPPSVLVDELLDYIESAAAEPALVRELLITKHPLHSFSKKYNLNDPRYYSYLLNTSGKSKEIFLQKNREEVDFEEISLHKMISFLKNPVQGYYNNVLGIYYDNEPVTLPDTEIFQMEFLARWALKNKLIKISEKDVDAFRKEQIKKGNLPLKNMAAVVLNQLTEEIQEVKELFGTVQQQKEERTIPVQLFLDGTTVKGTIANIYGDRQVVISFSKNENKYLMEAWITNLALRAAGFDITVHFISQSRKASFEGMPVSGEEAREVLKELILLYREGHQRILPFYSGFSINPQQISGPQDALKIAFESAMKDMFDNYQVPCNNRYLLKEYQNGFFNQPEVEKNYQEIARKLLLPLSGFFSSYPFKK